MPCNALKSIRKTFGQLFGKRSAFVCRAEARKRRTSILPADTTSAVCGQRLPAGLYGALYGLYIGQCCGLGRYRRAAAAPLA